MKNTCLFLLVTGVFILYTSPVNAQNQVGGWEISGGIGLSSMGEEAQDLYLWEINWNNDNASEVRNYDFSPGLYYSFQMRHLSYFGNVMVGPYISFSQFSSNFQSTIERPESLGWNYQKNNVHLMEYKFGLGLLIRYLEWEKNHHHIQPQIGIGLELQYAHRKVHEQKVRYHMIKEPAKFTFRESFRYRKVPPSIENDRYWTGQASLVYSYQKGKLIPFSEIGFRFVRELLTRSWHIPENWTLFYLNLGVRWHMSRS
ncbi:MAG: hypothetical protein EA362_05420 [Saprospirales bacterium]|nr:MAG: hypothetical protein EA362_05420 [Saprospirales bacterium]